MMLESGQTFAIGGLIQNSVQAHGHEGAGASATCRSSGPRSARSSTQSGRRELIILVTPRLVDADGLQPGPAAGAGPGDPQPGRL